MSSKPILYTPVEATRFIPQLIQLLPELRSVREEIVKAQQKCDIEELTSFGMVGAAAEDARGRIEECHNRIHSLERSFERKLRFFEDTGCELKSLDPGLVDFYWEYRGELVFLCWREGEPAIEFWHPLAGGFGSREPLPHDIG